MRVLVIDDEPMIRMIVSVTLEGCGEVLEAADGPAGLALLADTPVDVVLLDVMMPRMSGYEVLSRVRSSLDHPDVAVIMLTAKAGGDEHITAYRTGADAYLTKPFDPSCLRETVVELARLDPARRQSARRAKLGRAELLRQIETKSGG